MCPGVAAGLPPMVDVGSRSLLGGLLEPDLVDPVETAHHLRRQEFAIYHVMKERNSMQQRMHEKPDVLSGDLNTGHQQGVPS